MSASSRRKPLTSRVALQLASQKPATIHAVAPPAIGGLVTLSAEFSDSTPLVWEEICIEGLYLGHPMFDRIDWTREVFQTIVDNFHKNPAFKTGPDGLGCARVIPWDYEHASEIAKMNGTIPPGGCPSESWSWDLAIRDGEDGKAQLWSLTELLEPARTQIAQGKIQRCSVAVSPKSIDPVSGKDQGPTLTSIAFTNDPFIQGMEPLMAATKRALQTLDQWGPAESAIEVLVGLKRIFQLDADADAQAILDQIVVLRNLISSGMVPAWVPLDQVLGDIRRLLEVPLLTPPDEILGGAEQAVKEAISGGGNVEEPSTAPQVALEQRRMATAAILATLCSILGIAPDSDDAKVLQAASKTKEAADESKAADDLVTQLKAIFDAPGTGELLAKAAKACSDAKQLEPMMAALEGARAALTDASKANAEGEAAAIAASLSHGDAVIAKALAPTIQMARESCFDPKTLRDDPEKLKKFREQYVTPEVEQALLTRRVVAGPNGTQLGGVITGFETQPITQSRGNAGASTSDVEKLVGVINSQPGRNPVEKCVTLLASRDASFKALDFSEQCRRAGEFSRTVMAGRMPANFTL